MDHKSIWTIKWISLIWTIRFIVWTISYMDHMDHKVIKPYIIRDCERMDHENNIWTIKLPPHQIWTIKMLSYMDHKKYGP